MTRALRITWLELNYPTSKRVEDVNLVEKIQKGPLNCDSEKVLYLLKYKVCGEVSYIGKAKAKIRYRFNNYKSKHGAFSKGNQKVPQNGFHAHVVSMATVELAIGIL